MQEQFQLIRSNLAALGVRRLMALALAGILIFSAIAVGAIYVNKPAYETLYVGLERDDINRIGIVLADAGIGYDVSSDGGSVLVETGKTSNARMILAEKGLPGSAGSGYELFDKLGSLGLTSFMQEVTRVRVLEGEIARSIQAINGIKAARVHIVMPDRKSFTSRNREATASVLVRTNGAPGDKTAFSIRHLVAAAVPELSSENVTVLDASGKLLAAGEDPSTTMLSNSINVQRMVEEQLRSNIATALAPYLGSMNFRVSIQAVVDTDKRQSEETIFDPESRVERSVQVVRSQDKTSQQSASEPVTVEQNLPNAEPTSASGPQSSQDSERREETTNYEVSSKKIAVVSNGFSIKKVSASIVLNRERLTGLIGPEATDAQVQERIEQIKRMAMAAAGFDAQRGDLIEVSAVEFVDNFDGSALPEPSILEKISNQLGGIINSGVFLLVSLLMLFFGIRPLLNTATSRERTVADVLEADESPVALGGPDEIDQIAGPEDEFGSFSEFEDGLNADTESLFQQLKKTPEERLTELANENEELSAKILRRWINAEAA